MASAMSEHLVSLVVPFLNEEACIPAFLDAIEAYAASVSFPLEVLFVDDGSTDRSCEVLAAHTPRNTEMKLIRLSRNFGMHAAIRAGLSLAAGDRATFIGIDLQEPLSMIGEMYEKIQSGYDIVGAQKEEVQETGLRRLFSSLYADLMRKYASPNMPKGGCNSLMITRKVLDEFNRYCERNSSVMIQIINMGFQTTFIPCKYHERSGGGSKWTLSKKIKLFIDSFVSFSYFPIRCVSVIGILLFLLGVLYTLYLLISKLIHPAFYIQGWATLISVILIGFGLTNLSLGIIAEYLWRTLDASRNQPAYIIQSTCPLPRPTEK